MQLNFQKLSRKFKEVIRPVHLDYKNDPFFSSINFYKTFIKRLIRLPGKF